MKHRMKSRSKKTVIIAAAGTSVLALTVPITALATTTEPGSEAAGSHCTVDISGGPVQCFPTYRAAIAAATDGRVKDAPLDVRAAVANPAFRKKIDVAGTAAELRADAEPAAESSVVIGTEYLDANHTGKSMSFTAESKCTPDGPGFQVDQVPAEFNDAISSYQTFNDCQARHFADPGLKGDSTSWQIGGQLSVGDGVDNLTSSIQWNYAESPTTAQLFADCDEKIATCKFEHKGDVTYSYGGVHEVARAYNCTSIEQQKKMSWWDTTGGKNSLSVELGASYKIGNALVGSEYSFSFKTTYGHEWTWENRVSDETDLTVPAGEVGWVNRNTKMQTAGGEYTVTYKDRKWGHYIWYVRDFVATGPVPQEMGVVDWVSRPMSAAEKADHCKDGAAVVTDTPKKARLASTKSLPSTAHVLSGPR
jgi:hypothetical protein